jgi:predicted TIM-barrel fold metal-dependent hydrolase
MNRRSFFAVLGASIASCATDRVFAGGVQQAVPHSLGNSSPTITVPTDACDSHHHIYDGRFPVSPHWTQGFPANATVADYRLLQKRLGISRSVVVQPSTYGVDNRCLIDALRQLGRQARGVAVVDANVTDSELAEMSNAGVCAIRVNFVSSQSWGKTTADLLTSLGRRVDKAGWHVQILMTGEQIAEHETTIRSLPNRVVIDHLGRIPEPEGVNHAGFIAVRRLLDTGRVWVKLTEPYEDSKVGPPDYADSGVVARAYAQAAPERMLWGSDWPHPTQRVNKPDDAMLLDLLSSWAPDPADQHRILVSNPAELFGF